MRRDGTCKARNYATFQVKKEKYQYEKKNAKRLKRTQSVSGRWSEIKQELKWVSPI